MSLSSLFCFKDRDNVLLVENLLVFVKRGLLEAVVVFFAPTKIEYNVIGGLVGIFVFVDQISIPKSRYKEGLRFNAFILGNSRQSLVYSLDLLAFVLVDPDGVELIVVYRGEEYE